MKLEDLDIWSSNKAADIVFNVCIRHKLRFFGFEILAAPEHCFMIDLIAADQMYHSYHFEMYRL